MIELHNDLVALAKVCVVAFAVGLDVFAVSIGVGIAGLARTASLRLGVAFASSEVAMQLIGYVLGAHAGEMIGEFAAYLGFLILGVIGAVMVRSSLRSGGGPHFDLNRGSGLLAMSLSISLDSLGVGIALPAARIPLAPLLIVLSISTTVFTFVGLEFGARLGERYEHRAEMIAGSILILLAVLFTLEHGI